MVAQAVRAPAYQVWGPHISQCHKKKKKNRKKENFQQINSTPNQNSYKWKSLEKWQENLGISPVVKQMAWSSPGWLSQLVH
jgi:hypothetical protein